VLTHPRVLLSSLIVAFDENHDENAPTRDSGAEGAYCRHRGYLDGI
jgi:hypothetical protein